MNLKNENIESPINNKKSTPPTRAKVRNPFDKVLIDRLHKPICSPGMCKTYKNKSNNSFKWDIDQVCALVPADIVACNSQFEPSPDPALEKIAEEANEKFFSQDMAMPSPLEFSKKVKPLLECSGDSNIVTSCVKDKKQTIFREVSAQTVLTLPPKLPPEIENILRTYCTYTEDQDVYAEYEVTSNGSLRRKLYFEEHSDIEHSGSEQTDDEMHSGLQLQERPQSSYEAHTPVLFSPDLSRDLVSKGMKRTFGTPLQKGQASKPCYRNKILDVDIVEPCFSPIHFITPTRNGKGFTASRSLVSASISPIVKTTVKSDEKTCFTSPDSDAMATCLDYVESGSEGERKPNPACYCETPNKSILTRSTSLKDQSPFRRTGSLAGKRSLSMSSLNRSRSVQKLDFSMDMSVDGSNHNHSQDDSESSPYMKDIAWNLQEDESIKKILEAELKSDEMQSSTKIMNANLLDGTPIKGKRKTNILHDISKIRTSALSPVNMSLDDSLDCDIPAVMEHKIDFNKVDLKFLTENDIKCDGTIFKKIDSGFNDNTFYTNASSYYESAIKPSELTVTDTTNTNTSRSVLKETFNTNWIRVDSGFNENSTDSQFYTNDAKTVASFQCAGTKLLDKENEEFDRFLVQNKNNAISMSDIFSGDLTFNCNSSTPSKNKSRKVNT